MPATSTCSSNSSVICARGMKWQQGSGDHQQISLVTCRSRVHLLQVLVGDPDKSGGQAVRLLPAARKAAVAIMPLRILKQVQCRV